jgi:D-alanyl-D-alanine dipeptidase
MNPVPPASTRIDVRRPWLLPWLCSCLLASGCALSPAAATPELLDLAALAPDIRIEMRYATTENFTGGIVDGYHARRCLLSRPAAEALAGLQAELRAFGLSLVMYDCYRPQRAVDHFARWARDPAEQSMKARYYPNEDKARLFERGYIAKRSGHSRGSTVDLGLVDPSGRELDMGTGWDYLDPLSATANPALPDTARRNRLLLHTLLDQHGFDNYAEEWWHYTLRQEPYPDSYFDIEIR